MRTVAAVLGLVTLAVVTTANYAQGQDIASTAPLPVGVNNTLLLVLAAPKAGAEQAFDSWRANHMAEFTRIPGVLSARRSTLLPLAAVGVKLPPAMAMYELAGSKLDGFDAEVARRLADGRITKSPAVDYDGLISIKARPLGPAMYASAVSEATPEPLGSSGTIKEYQFIVFSDPTTPDVEKQYNDWYDHQHMPDVLRVPGFVFAQRFIITSESPSNATARYFILFNLRSRDLAATNADIVRRMREKITVPTTTMGNGTAAFMEPAGPPVLGAKSKKQ